MYFVERKQIRETLVYIEGLLKAFDKDQELLSYSDKLSLERTVHMLIESILDVGNMMIDGFVMRDPGSYEDIIDILMDERVIPENEGESYKKLIRLRKMVVIDYLEIDHDQIFNVLAETQDVLLRFPQYVTTYLKEEIDVPHAFTNE